MLVLTKAGPRAGNTGYAQGGIAAAVGPDDSPAQPPRRHDRRRRRPVRRARGRRPGRRRSALRPRADGLGRRVRSRLRRRARARRSRRRTARAACCTRATRPAARSAGRSGSASRAIADVRTHAHARVVSLIVEDGRCAGVEFLQDDGTRAVGAGAVHAARDGRRRPGVQRDDEPAGRDRRRRGDGLPRRARASPTSSSSSFIRRRSKVPGQPRFLLSEALRGEGARLVNAAGEAFMARYDPAGDLAPRDRVARAIVREAQRTGGRVFLSLDRLDPAFVHARFPLIAEACRARRPRSRDRSHPGRPGGALRDGRRRRPISTGGRRCRGCSRPARWRAPASTARIGWRATRCSRAWSSARAPALAMKSAAGMSSGVPLACDEPWSPPVADPASDGRCRLPTEAAAR